MPTGIATWDLPRLLRTQKQREAILIREFIDSLGFQIRHARWSERPDAFLTIERRNQVKCVAIEQTDYLNDTVSGTASPLSSTRDFWDDVQSSLIRRISHRPHLTGVDATVRLNQKIVSAVKHTDRTAVAKLLASDLVRFAESNPIEILRTGHWRGPDFQGYPNLKSAVTSLHMTRYANRTGGVNRCEWSCSDVRCGTVSLSPAYIASAVARKNIKAVGYQRRKAEEMWLLISAGSGDGVNHHAGPIELSGSLASDSSVLSHCANSPFDRIVFWERAMGWYQWLKPMTLARSY